MANNAPPPNSIPRNQVYHPLGYPTTRCSLIVGSKAIVEEESRRLRSFRGKSMSQGIGNGVLGEMIRRTGQGRGVARDRRRAEVEIKREPITILAPYIFRQRYLSRWLSQTQT